MSTSEDSKPIATKTLPDDVVARYTLEAKKEGLFAGMASGLASAVLGGRLLGLNRNKTLLSGVLSGVLAGYLFTQAFTLTAIARANQALQATSSQNGNPGESALPSA